MVLYRNDNAVLEQCHARQCTIVQYSTVQLAELCAAYMDVSRLQFSHTAALLDAYTSVEKLVFCQSAIVAQHGFILS